MPGHHFGENLPERAKRFGGERGSRIDSGIAGGLKQAILRAQRQEQAFGQLQHHLAAGIGAAGFQEGKMAGRDVARERKVELAEPPRGAETAQLPRKACGIGQGCWGAVRHPR